MSNVQETAAFKIDFGGLGTALIVMSIVAGMAISDWAKAGYPGLGCGCCP